MHSIEEDVFNQETLQAIMETEQMINHPETREEGYDSAESMMDDLLGTHSDLFQQ